MDFTNFKGVIFDLDGTLVESNSVWSDIDIEFLGRRGLNVPADYFKAVSTMNFEQAAVYTKKRFGLPESTEKMIEEWNEMAINHYTYDINEVEGAAGFVKELKNRGIKIALATASSELLYKPVLQRNGMYDCFDTFVTTADVSRGKGFPDVYEKAAENLGLAACECVVFEDIIEGIEAAKLGGFTAVACLNDHYIADREKLKARADFYFKSYHELM